MKNPKIYSFIGEYDKGMSNEQIAEKLNVAPITIQRIKEGKYEPSVSLALELAKLLGCKVEDLFELVGGK